MPAIDHMDELLTYFEHTYVRGRRLRGRGENYSEPLFAIASWNQRTAAADGLARTTNSVEGWHYGLQALFQCSHPTLWKFFIRAYDRLLPSEDLFPPGRLRC